MLTTLLKLHLGYTFEYINLFTLTLFSTIRINSKIVFNYPKRPRTNSVWTRLPIEQNNNKCSSLFKTHSKTDDTVMFSHHQH